MNQISIKITLRLPFVGKTKRLVGGTEKVYAWGINKEMLDAELWAILEALGITRMTVDAGNTPINFLRRHLEQLCSPNGLCKSYIRDSFGLALMNCTSSLVIILVENRIGNPMGNAHDALISISQIRRFNKIRPSAQLYYIFLHGTSRRETLRCECVEIILL